jgi:hypothetical protein
MLVVATFPLQTTSQDSLKPTLALPHHLLKPTLALPNLLRQLGMAALMKLRCALYVHQMRYICP